MGTRGRKSSASLSVVTNLPGQRPEPPIDLTKAQADIWRSTVASEAADFFRTAAAQALLTDYCRHADAANVLAVEINKGVDLTDDEGLKRYDVLLRARDRETKAAADKLTKLRLTNQARYTPASASTAAKKAVNRPWDD